MELESMTRPVEVFRERVLQMGGELGARGRKVGVIALRRGAGALATTATRLDGLADKLEPGEADASIAVAEPATATESPAGEPTAAEATASSEPAAWADAAPPAPASSDFEIEAEEAEPLVTVREKKSKKR